jgi:hypothetical protein
VPMVFAIGGRRRPEAVALEFFDLTNFALPIPRSSLAFVPRVSAISTETHGDGHG